MSVRIDGSVAPVPTVRLADDARRRFHLGFEEIARL